MIIQSVNWSMHYYNWQTNTVAPFQAHTNTHAQTHTHTKSFLQTSKSNWHFLNVNNTSPAPPNLEETDRKEKVSGTWASGEQLSYNLPLYHCICIHLVAFCLCTFPNESPSKSKTDQPAVTLRLTEMINCHDKLYLSLRVLPPLSWDAWAIVVCPYRVHDLRRHISRVFIGLL